jgi:predicted Zn finger-like uncharacterized protein
LRILCPNCEAGYNIQEDKIKINITKLKCKKCDFTFVITVHDIVDESSWNAPANEKSENGQEEKWISDAKRLAEVIVSDIHIYNKDKVTNCKTDEELVIVLGAELKKGRKFYMEKVNTNLKDPNKYYAEAVRKFLKIKK